MIGLPESDRGDVSGRTLDALNLMDEDDLVRFVTELWRIGKARKRQREGLWSKHLAHYDGDQWAAYDSSKGVIVHTGEDELGPHRVRICASLLPVFIGQMIAKMCEGKLSWRVDP